MKKEPTIKVSKEKRLKLNMLLHLKGILAYRNCFMCNEIDRKFPGFKTLLMEDYLPELDKYKPKDVWRAWGVGETPGDNYEKEHNEKAKLIWAYRKRAVNKAIKEVENS